MIGFGGGLLAVLILASVPVAVVLVLLAVVLAEVYSFFPLLPALGEISWTASTEFILVAVPVFILMGEVLLRSGIAADMFRAIDAWMGRVPGGLMHTNVASCALFAATSGSSVATAATVGTVAIPELDRAGYNRPLFLGSIAAGGTLGILIPPSINMIIYGVLAEVSIGDLYLAGLIPGLMLAALFSLAILVACVIRPEWSGERRRTSWSERIRTLPALLPPILLFLVVVGSIYAGVATPTEAASLGLIAAIGLAAWRGRLDRALFLRAFEGAMRTTAMVMLIVLAAFFLNFVMTTIGLTDAVARAMRDVALPPAAVILVIIGIYLVLGCFMDTLSLMIATTPIVVPVVVALGYDPVWFGVLFMILIEAALITPPIGVNLFVVQTVRGTGPISDVIVGALPFLAMMIVMMLLLLAVPGLALWLPSLVR